MMPAVQEVWIAVQPIDMRAGIDGLTLRVQEALGRSPCDGSAYAFRNRRGNRLKVLTWDGTGVWMCQRRLHRGVFVWPRAQEALCCLSEQAWDYLVRGVDWERLEAPAPRHWVV